MRISVGVLAVVVVSFLGTSPLHAQNSPEGAWTVVEAWGQNPTDGEWRVGDTLQPSLFLFTDGHYSIAWVGQDHPRPLMPEGATRSTLTPEQADSVWIPYTSNSGTFEVEGSTLVTHPMVALIPNFMEKGTTRSYELDWDGDDMLLRTTGDGLWYVWKLKRLGRD